MKMNFTRSAHNCLAITDAGPYCASMALPGRSYCAEHLADRCGGDLFGNPVAETPARVDVRAVKTNIRKQMYTGPFPRGRHSHKCCSACGGGSVACYKAQCVRPQTGTVCGWCNRPLN